MVLGPGVRPWLGGLEEYLDFFLFTPALLLLLIVHDPVGPSDLAWARAVRRGLGRLDLRRVTGSTAPSLQRYVLDGHPPEAPRSTPASWTALPAVAGGRRTSPPSSPSSTWSTGGRPSATVSGLLRAFILGWISWFFAMHHVMHQRPVDDPQLLHPPHKRSPQADRDELRDHGRLVGPGLRDLSANQGLKA